MSISGECGSRESQGQVQRPWWGCTCYVHGPRRKAAWLEWSDGAGTVAEGSLITEGLAGHCPDLGFDSARIGEPLENYTQRSVAEGIEVSKTLAGSCVDNSHSRSAGVGRGLRRPWQLS